MLSMHFRWLFSSKTYVKQCQEMQKIQLTFLMSIPKKMLINCNNLYLLHHRNDQIHVNSNHPLKLLKLAEFLSITNSLHITHKLLMCHFTHNHQNDTPVHKSNASKFSKCETHHKQCKTLKILLDTNIASRFCVMHSHF